MVTSAPSGREWLASVSSFPMLPDDGAFNASSYGAERPLGGEAVQRPYVQPFAPVSTSRLSGKRSRSNSPDSCSDSSPPTTSSSAWSSSSSQSSNRSASTPPSPPSSQDSDAERGCPSPTAAKRKAVRCRRQETACAASLRRQLDSLNVGSGSAQTPSTSLATSPHYGSTHVHHVALARGPDSQDSSPESSAAPPYQYQPCVQSSTVESGCSADADVGTTDVMKEVMVDHLVGVALETIYALWYRPLSLPEEMPCTAASSLSLRLFVRETLRRSRTSCSTLQAALLYCLRCGPAIRKRQGLLTQEAQDLGISPAEYLVRDQPSLHPLLCGRRIFLASIMVAAKFLQDKTFSNRAWSKITGLPVKQLASVEREFLAGIQWDLNVKDEEWKAWTLRLTNAKAAKLQAVGSCARSALSLPSATREAFESHTSSRTATPTPTTSATPKVGRSLLARSHSNDVGTAKVYDASTSGAAPPTAHPLSRRAHLGAESMEREAKPISSLASSECEDAAKPEEGGDAVSAALPLLAAPKGPPAPYPMHRSFVRSSASFSTHPASDFNSSSSASGSGAYAKALSLVL